MALFDVFDLAGSGMRAQSLRLKDPVSIDLLRQVSLCVPPKTGTE